MKYKERVVLETKDKELQKEIIEALREFNIISNYTVRSKEDKIVSETTIGQHKLFTLYALGFKKGFIRKGQKDIEKSLEGNY